MEGLGSSGPSPLFTMAYATQANVEAIFGASNVNKWANIEQDGVAATITARIVLALENADSTINDYLRDSRYTIPFTSSPLPLSLVDTAARLAGIWLYESRGVVDMDMETEKPIHKLMWHQKRVDKWLRNAKVGRIKLDEDTTTGHPEVVSHELTS